MGLFSFTKEIAIDLGTANTIIIHNGKIILDEPSIVAVDTRTGKMVAVGHEAKLMQGKEWEGIKTIRPLRQGVIADFNAAELMIRGLIKKATPKNSWFSPSLRMVVGIPSGSTEVEIRAVRDSSEHAGGRDVYMIYEPMAAALGIGLDVEAPEGNMVVDIGGGTTEIAIISLGGIVTAKSIRIGGDEFDESIVSYVKKTYNLAIGERTAEDVKISIGSTFKDDQEQNMQIRGRDLISGLPKTIEISSSEVRDALKEPINSIVDGIKSTLEKTPPELASDIMENGIMLTGGGALLRGLDKLVKQETGMPVQIAENPLDCVALGTGKSVEDQEIFEKVLMMNARK